MANVISWFEIPVNNMDRAVAFYESILDVKMESMNVHGENLAVFPAKDDEVNGALIEGSGYSPSVNGTLVYLNAGEDLNNVLSKVEPAGGKIVEGKIEVIKGSVYAAVFQDTEGNKVGLFSNK